MANQNLITGLQQTLDQIKQLDPEKLYRDNLGRLSKRQKLAPIFDGIIERSEIIKQASDQLSDNVVSGFIGLLQQCIQYLNTISGFDDASYAAQSDAHITALDQFYQQMEGTLSYAASIAVMKSGILKPQVLEQGASEVLNQYTEQLTQKIAEFEKQANTKINDLLEISAKSIQDKTEKATRTSQGISLGEVQMQFNTINQKLTTGLKVWIALGVFSIIIFFGLTAIFIGHIPINQASAQPLSTTPSASTFLANGIYSIAIRVTILSAVGALAAYFMNLFKSNLHMYYKNQHRIALANSTGAFIASCRTPETQDVVFSYLVQNVADFGESGLLDSKEDNIHPSKIMIDTIKTIIEKKS